MTAVKYFIIANLCLFVFFSFYKIFFSKETNFKQVRLYLIFSILFSVIMPFNTLELDLGISFNENVQITETQPPVTSNNVIAPNQGSDSIVENEEQLPFKLNWNKVIIWVYVFVVSFFLLRILAQGVKLLALYLHSDKEKYGSLILAYNSRIKSISSFFNIVFINKKYTDESDLQELLSHEEIHAIQYHSIDLILVELLAAVMWFNPVVWFIRSNIQLVHEYLADEGALSTGIDKLRYQALLVNQVTEERLICLSSGFNPAQTGRHSLIKKRLIMMTKRKFNHKTKLKILALLPVTLMLFLGIACVNGQTQDISKVVTAVAATKMNVLYEGIDNPIKIAVSGYESSAIEVTTSNGTIDGENGEYVVRPARPGNTFINVMVDGKIIQTTEFRVRGIPEPVITLAGRTGGRIAKNIVLAQEEVRLVFYNFDFDLTAEIVGFTISTTDSLRYYVDAKSSSNKISEDQKQLLRNAKRGDKITIEEIKYVDPEGEIKDAAPTVFEIE